MGRHKTGPCEASVTNGTWTPYIFSAALFYALWAILCFSNFRHGQAWHHRCGSKGMGQTASLLAWLPHGLRPTAPLGAEACPWFSFYFFFLNIKQSWLMDTMTPRKISTAPLFVAQHRNTRNYKNLLICRWATSNPSPNWDWVKKVSSLYVIGNNTSSRSTGYRRFAGAGLVPALK